MPVHSRRYRCFYKGLFVAAFIPFLLLYLKFSVPAALPTSIRPSTDSHWHGRFPQKRTIADRTHHEIDVLNSPVEETVIGQSLNFTTGTDEYLNQELEHSYDDIFYDENLDDETGYYFGQSHHIETDLTENMTNPVEETVRKKKRLKQRKNKMHLPSKPDTVGIDVWRYMNDTTIKYNGTRYSVEDKPKLMKQFYPVLFKELTKPRLADYKNPCFCKSHGATCGKAWACLPYFYLIGAPKSGTTDLWFQLHRHPSIVASRKEPHWWTRHTKEMENIFGYFDNQRNLIDKAMNANQRTQYIIGDGSASTLWDNSLLLKRSLSLTGQLSLPFTWADVIHFIQPDAKIIAVFRNPVDRLISDYFAFYKNPSPEDFHSLLLNALKTFKDCLKKYNLRFCANLPYHPRIQIGLYIAHVQEWFGVFPRRQVFVLRTEDWHLHRQMKTLPRLHQFLEIDPFIDDALPSLSLKAAENVGIKAVTRTRSQMYGNIWTKSKDILQEFYKPYNEQLTALLRDPRFLWIDGPPR